MQNIFTINSSKNMSVHLPTHRQMSANHVAKLPLPSHEPHGHPAPHCPPLTPQAPSRPSRAATRDAHRARRPAQLGRLGRLRTEQGLKGPLEKDTNTRTDIYIYIHAPRLLVAPSPKVWHPPSVAMASPFPQDDPSHQLQISTSVPFSSPKKETFKKQQKNETIGTYIFFSSKTTRFFHQIFF